MYHVKMNGRTVDSYVLSCDAHKHAEALEELHPDRTVKVTEDNGPRYDITTYADARGLWHAIVRDPAHDTSKRLTDNEVRNIRDAGKRAILRELYEREESPTRTRTDITTQVRIVWSMCKQRGRTAYIGSPDTLHIAETPAK